MLLNLLKGLVFFLSISAFISLTAAIIEARVQRALSRDADYLFAISLLTSLCWAGIPVAMVMTVNYTWRFFTGLTGSLLPGPKINTIVSLTSLSAAFLFLTGLGILLLWVLWQSYDPSEEEMRRRRRIVDARSRVERGRTRSRRQGGWE